MGHPLSYSYSNPATTERRTQTVPANAFRINNPHSPTVKSSSVPTVLSDSTAVPSPVTPPRLHSPEPNSHPRSVDLETGREVPVPKKRWWKRNNRGTRRHSEATLRAHQKSVLQIFREILFSGWVNLLLVCVPVGIALHFVNVNPTVVFVMNFLAIVPLAGVCISWFFRLLSFNLNEMSELG